MDTILAVQVFYHHRHDYSNLKKHKILHDVSDLSVDIQFDKTRFNIDFYLWFTSRKKAIN